MNKSLEVLDPVFSKERDWFVARQTFLRLEKFLQLAKEITNGQPIASSDSTFAIVQRLSSTVRSMFGNVKRNENLTRVVDLSIAILHDGAQLTEKMLDRHANDLNL